MKILIVVLALLVMATLVVGCRAAPKKKYSGLVVKISQKGDDNKWRSGTGAVIGPRRVVTTFHVVDEKGTPLIRLRGGIGKRINWVEFKIVTLVDNNEIEPFVILEANKNVFCKSDAFKIGTGAPCEVLTRRGKFHWREYTSVSGDSGSPVVNDDMEIVGVIYGRIKRDGKMVPLMIPVKGYDDDD